MCDLNVTETAQWVTADVVAFSLDKDGGDEGGEKIERVSTNRFVHRVSLITVAGRLAYDGLTNVWFVFYRVQEKNSISITVNVFVFEVSPIARINYNQMVHFQFEPCNSQKYKQTH